MTDRCQQDLAALYEVIMARLQGRQVSQAGHRGRSIAYAETSVGDLIKLYNQLWLQCGASSGLPQLNPLDMPVGRRGRPATVRFGNRG